MGKTAYSSETVDAALADLAELENLTAVSRKYGITKHAIYRFRRERELAPEGGKDKKIKQLSKNLKEKDLENQILRQLLKKTYQVMPIGEGWQRNS